MAKRIRFNWKARAQSKKSKSIHSNVNFEQERNDTRIDNLYDEANAFALPSKKVKVVVSKNRSKNLNVKSSKILKAERKSQILAQKVLRKSLLNKLSSCKDDSFATKIQSISTHQTLGKRKRDKSDLVMDKKQVKTIEENEETGSSDSGSDDSKEMSEVCLSSNKTNHAKINKNEDMVTNTNIDATSKSIKPKDLFTYTKSSSCGIEKKVAHVQRSESVQKNRLALPIISEEQVIMESINENNVIVLIGETGSGKTTQIPQFLYEAGYANGGKCIAITQPRRIAAIAMANRVRYELGNSLVHGTVSHCVRFDDKVTLSTRIKFMTDGILLKEMRGDFFLHKYSVVVIDEAHERSVHTDILLGLLSRLIILRNSDPKHSRNPLKLIIMSATLDASSFVQNKRLFSYKVPVIKIPTRQHPVTIHFNKRTYENYLQQAYNKVCKIHQELPAGNILVFVTGRAEVVQLCKALSKTFSTQNFQKSVSITNDSSRGKKSCGENLFINPLYKRKDRVDGAIHKKTSFNSNFSEINLHDYPLYPEESDGHSTEQVDSDEEKEALEKDHGNCLNDRENVKMAIIKSRRTFSCERLHVLPLYALLDQARQNEVFEDSPFGHRKCVVATNVAETALTIPGIKYVVDCGKVKMLRISHLPSNAFSFRVGWTSKASAQQRAGRAGRLAPGHCYRLYSSAVFNDEFDEHCEPDILRKPTTDLLLLMKAMHIDKIHNFPFPTPPPASSIESATRDLIALRALEERVALESKDGVKLTKNERLEGEITNLGFLLSQLPLSTQYSKMVITSFKDSKLLPYAVLMSSVLSVQEFFIDSNSDASILSIGGEKDGKEKSGAQPPSFASLMRVSSDVTSNSFLLGDVMPLLKLMGAFLFCDKAITPSFCQKYRIRFQALVEAKKLFHQVCLLMQSLFPDECINLKKHDPLSCRDATLDPIGDDVAYFLRQLLLICAGQNIARKKEAGHDFAHKNVVYECLKAPHSSLFIHPSSSLYKLKPEYLVYQSLFRNGDKTYIKVCTSINAIWIPMYLQHMCKLISIHPEPFPKFDKESGVVKCFAEMSIGVEEWKLPIAQINYPYSLENFKYFAFFFLKGEICPMLHKFLPSLLSPPLILFKSWSHLQPRTQAFLSKLVESDVCSYQSLLNKWQSSTEASFLLSEYLQWLPESKHKKVQDMWPPISSKRNKDME